MQGGGALAHGEVTGPLTAFTSMLQDPTFITEVGSVLQLAPGLTALA